LRPEVQIRRRSRVVPEVHWASGERVLGPWLYRVLGPWLNRTFPASTVNGIAEEMTVPLAESVALKRRTVASASRCASHSRRMRLTLSRISSLRDGLRNQRNDARPLYQSVYTKLYACIGPSGDTRHSEVFGFVIQSDCDRSRPNNSREQNKGA